MASLCQVTAAQATIAFLKNQYVAVERRRVSSGICKKTCGEVRLNFSLAIERAPPTRLVASFAAQTLPGTPPKLAARLRNARQVDFSPEPRALFPVNVLPKLAP